MNFEQATPEQIGMYLPTTRTLAASKCTVRYKLRSGSTWLAAQPLLHIDVANALTGGAATLVDAYAGSIFDLTPGTQYDIELTLVEAGQPTKVSTYTATTRALPAAAGTPNKTLTTAGNLQTTLNGLVAGDVLQLAAGTYTVSSLTMTSSGSSGSPIYVRGAARDTVIIQDTTGTVISWGASNVVLENLTITGSGTDSGTSSTSQGIFCSGDVSNVTIRNIVMTGVDKGIASDSNMVSTLVYECKLTGNNVWDSSIHTNATWNDDGIRVPGQGNAVWQNTITGFGDATAMVDGIVNTACYFYRNLIPMTGDDSIEGDYGTRNCAFYDNYITNASTFLSLDPLYGGPFYFFRNTIINCVRGPYKLNNQNTGFFIFNNTCVRVEGTTTWGWVQFNNGDLTDWAYVNNILVYRGSPSGQTFAVESTKNTPVDFTNNAWYPDGKFWWTNTGGTFNSLALALAGVSATTPLNGTATKRNTSDVITVSNPFAATITLGTDDTTQFVGTPSVALSGGATPKNAGLALANINDGFTGGAPDMGSNISGRSLPQYGRTEAWSPPYTVPTTLNSSKKISSNSSIDVAPAVYNVGGDAGAAWFGATWNVFSGPTFVPTFSTGGAFIMSNSGGHSDPNMADVLIFDATDGLWKYQLNANGVTPANYGTNSAGTNGTPYYEYNSATSGQMPAGAHLYATTVYINEGTNGRLMSVARAGITSDSVLGAAVHIQDLASRQWTRGSNDATSPLGAGTGNDSGRGFEYSVQVDNVVSGGRAYIIPAGVGGSYGQITYVKVSDRTVHNISNTHPSVTGDGNYPKSLIYETGRLLMAHSGNDLPTGIVGMDLTNDTTIGNGFVTMTVTGVLPNSGNIWAYHPTNNKWYYTKQGGDSNKLYVLTPPAGSGSTLLSSTWVGSTITITDQGVVARTLSNSHYSCLAYCAALDMLLWCPDGTDVYAIKV